MASLSTTKAGLTSIYFIGADGRRRQVRLGRVPERDAQAIRHRVEALVTAQITGGTLSRETALWVAGLTEKMHDKLARVGLVEPLHRSGLGSFIDAYITAQDVKPSTVLTYKRARNHLVQFFGEERDLRTVTHGDADDWWSWMLKTRKPKLAENTARKSVSIARQFIKAAKRKRLVDADPFEHLASTVRPNRSRDRYIDRDAIAKVLDACPDAQWRLMVALARFAGLRMPSEIKALRWSDVDWAGNRFTVHASKTERHEHGGERVVPIFPALRPYLMDAFDLAEGGAEFVVPSYRHDGARAPQLKL